MRRKSFQMTAAVLSTKRLCDLAVGRILLEGQKIKDKVKKKKSKVWNLRPRKMNLTQKLELPQRRNPCLVVNACYPLFTPRPKPHWALCWAKVNWCIRLVFQQMSAELSSHTVALSNTQSYSELIIIQFQNCRPVSFLSYKTNGRVSLRNLHGHTCTGCIHLSCQRRKSCCLQKSYPVSRWVWRDASHDHFSFYSY